MGEVSYAFMRRIINKRIDKELAACGRRYQILADALIKDDPDYTQKLLELSVKMNNQCKEIALKVLNEYPIEVSNDPVLAKLKESASKV